MWGISELHIRFFYGHRRFNVWVQSSERKFHQCVSAALHVRDAENSESRTCSLFWRSFLDTLCQPALGLWSPFSTGLSKCTALLKQFWLMLCSGLCSEVSPCFCAKSTHGLRVCRCSRCCPVSLSAGWWDAEAAGGLSCNPPPVLHLPTGLRCLWHCHSQLGFLLHNLIFACQCSSMALIPAPWLNLRKSWVWSSFAPLSPSCCFLFLFLFSCSLKRSFNAWSSQEGNIQELFLWQPVKSSSSVC